MFKRILYMFLAVAVAFSAVVLPMSVNKPTASAESEPESYTHYVSITGRIDTSFVNSFVFVVSFISSSSTPVVTFAQLSSHSPLTCVSSPSTHSTLVGLSFHFTTSILQDDSSVLFCYFGDTSTVSFILIGYSLVDTVVANSSGSDSGYDDGYADGLTAGQQQGYTDGYDDGLTAGQEQGYTEGYQAGYQYGYDLGYDAASDAVIGELFEESFSRLVSYPSDRFPLVTSGVDLTTTTVTFNKLGITSTFEDCLRFDYADGEDTTLNYVTVELPLPTTIPHDSSLYLDGVLFSVSSRLDTIYVQYKDSDGNLQLLTSFVSNTPTVSSTFPLAFTLPVDVSSIFISCASPIAIQDLDLYFASSVNIVYSTGYNVGVQAGRVLGWDEAQVTVTQTSASYESGYQNGITQASDYTFFNMISAVIDVPIRAFTGLFNFEVFGVNLAPFFTALLTIALVCAVLKLVF